MIATTNALVRFERLEPGEFSHTERAAFLALSVLVDRDLDSGNGYGFHGIYPDRVARILGTTIATADLHLRNLARRGELVLVLRDPIRGLEHVTGDEIPRLENGRKRIGYRIPEEVFS